ncbi:MAG TPA: FAD binding domain-containing protein [Candidatus Obscuribacterales bacterium]
MRDYLLLYINGKEYRIRGADAFKTLSNFLRYDEQKTGTKIVCEEGDCGACTVVVGRVENGEIVYKPINSCIQFLYQLDCSHVVTVEGVRDDGDLNAVQQAMIECHGAQCGYCTPGFVVAMCALFEDKDNVTAQDVRDALTGNLCRCTGYDSIINSALQIDTQRLKRMRDLYPAEKVMPALEEHAGIPVLIEYAGRKYFNPADLEGALKFKSENPSAIIVAGATDVGVYCNKKGFDPPAVMSLSNVPGLSQLAVEDGVLVVGAKTSLALLEQLSKDLIPELYQILWTFGGPGIKHAGTLAGNIANGSPIADTLPFLFVMDAEVEVKSVSGQRTIKVRSLYKGYKSLDIKPEEIITRVLIPLPTERQTLKLYKVSRRKNLDISAFTAALLLTRSGSTIESVRIAYGGVAPLVLSLPQTEAFLAGKEHSLETFQAAGEVARREISPISDVRGSADFRYQLAENILLKFYYETAGERELVCR